MSVLRPRVVLDPSALVRNLAEIEKRVGEHCGVVVMLKANAYGHGLLEVAAALEDCDVTFGLSEAADVFALREAGCSRPLMLVGPASTDEHVALMAAGVTVTIDDVNRLQLLIQHREHSGGSVDLLADTGMRRLGIAPGDLPDVIALARSAGMTVRAVGIHPRSGDTGDWLDVEAEIRQVTDALSGQDILRHSGGTSMALERPDLAGSQVRVGIGVFGHHPHPRQRSLATLTPAMRVEAPVLALRSVEKGDLFSYAGTPPADVPMTIATLGAGASHGITADIAEGSHVLIGGTPAPYVGEPTLDYVQVNVTDVPTVHVGDYATVLGGPAGSGTSVPEIAARLGVVPDHILVRISPRIRREVLS
jgi:alanine racemase